MLCYYWKLISCSLGEEIIFDAPAVGEGIKGFAVHGYALDYTTVLQQQTHH